jgi:Zn-dependent M28 family amino/carboxypeptidase
MLERSKTENRNPKLVPVLSLLVLLALAGGRLPAADDAVEARMRKDITYLASDECEGRGVETKGINLAANFIAQEFQKAGLKPGAADGSYFQPFTMTGTAKLESPNTLRLHGPQGQDIELEMGKHFYPLGLSGAGQVTAPVVFVGYGISADKVPYDDYKDVDVAGKVVIVVRKSPRSDNSKVPFDGARKRQHEPFTTKLVKADLHKARAVLFISDRHSAAADDRLDAMEHFSSMAAASTPTGLPAVQVRRSVVDAMLQSSLGTGLRELEEDIDHDLKPHSAPLTGWTVSIQTSVRRPKLNVKNVVGVLEGSGPLAKETIVLGAHYDHLGYGGPYSLARGSKDIHHGADDNASGTTSLIELARRFGQMPKREGRRLVFIAFSGEESGLLGSEYYCEHPLIPISDTAAMVNMDMVGRLAVEDERSRKKDELQVWGIGTAKTFDGLIENLNKKYEFKLKKVKGGFGPSDHSSFYAKKIPVLFFFTGDHKDYHRPSDTADKINVPGMRRVADMVQDVVVDLAQASKRPEYVKAANDSADQVRYDDIPRLGFRPGSYGEEDGGVLVGGLNPGGAAEKAGIKEGDRIIEIAGKPVKNMSSYMVLMAAQKKGAVLDIGVLRDGKKLAIKVTPQ